MRTRLLSALLAFASLAPLAACDKPTEADCTKAIQNLDKLHDVAPDPKKEAASVRKCQASSSKSSVECMMKATTVEQANACK
jgi:hypothetical protein